MQINGHTVPEVGHYSRLRALLRAAIVECEKGAKTGDEAVVEEFTTVERELHGVLVRLS